MTKTTYGLGGIGGLGLDSKLEIRVEPTRNWRFARRLKTTVTADCYVVDNYSAAHKAIKKSAELTPDKSGTADATTENRDALYELARLAKHDIVNDLSPKNNGDNYKDIQYFLEKCLEAETGLAPMRDYRRGPGQGPLTTFQKIKMELEIVNSGRDPPI